MTTANLLAVLRPLPMTELLVVGVKVAASTVWEILKGRRRQSDARAFRHHLGWVPAPAGEGAAGV
ncbi:hypothetical protein ACFHW2_42960 [Actinomadura sp. LOL_016]|uniref:hypothetical protein n=1 Tax=unclassified Actinomadura TaxID=2626254 RepID=UPI003A802CAA